MKSAETRKKQYDSGERIQWNKGKKWTETYSKKQQEELKNILLEGIRERIENGTFSLSSRIEKEFIDTCVIPLGIEFDTQYYIKELRHFCDVYIPSTNTIIEFQGDYWHGNPNKYGKEDLTPYQLNKVEKDEELRNYCDVNGIKLIEIWESDYRQDYKAVKNLINETINGK